MITAAETRQKKKETVQEIIFNLKLVLWLPKKNLFIGLKK